MEATIVIFIESSGKGSSGVRKGIHPITQKDLVQGIIAGIPVLQCLLNVQGLNGIIEFRFYVNIMLSKERKADECKK